MEHEESKQAKYSKVDETFWRECKEAFIELNDSGELQRLMRQRVMRQRVLSTKVTPQKQPEKS